VNLETQRPAQTDQHLRTLVTAARKRERVEIDYVSASRHQSEHRPVDPYGIVHHAGEWYVVGHCHKRGDVRTFRIDRIAALRTTGERFDRGTETAFAQEHRVEAAREIAQLRERLRQLVERTGDDGAGVVGRGRKRRDGEPKSDRDRDQALLCPVVQVALESPAGLVRGADDPHA
jgi:predicted DNA-binding transcriptional regulator YafY